MVLAGSEPYPWPFHGALQPCRSALVIAGAQPAWADRCPEADVNRVSRLITILASTLRPLGALVVGICHTRAPGAVVAPGGPRPSLPPVAGDASGLARPDIAALAEVMVSARGINGFYGSGLDALLRGRGITDLVLCGFGAEACVDSTLRAANDRGYECLTLRDAVAAFDVGTGAGALSSITMSGGIFGAIADSTDLLRFVSNLPISMSVVELPNMESGAPNE